MPNKLTLEKAQAKLDSVNQNLKLLEFNGTAKQCVVQCNECGIIFNVPKFRHLTDIAKNGKPNTQCNCKTHHKSTKQEAQIKLNAMGYYYNIIEYNGINNKSKLQCKNCGAILEVKLKHIFQYNTCYLCRNCNPKANIPRGERIALHWLEDNNIDNIYQYYIRINNKKHYFDFYIPKKKLFIEIDGEQHREIKQPWGGKQAFNNQQIRDAEKDMHCHWNGYNLLRIPVDQKTSNEDIIRILENELK